MKKLLLTLGTLATIASPIVAVVSCSETKKATHVEIHNETPFEKARDSLLKVLNHYMFLTPAQKTEYTKNIQGAKTTDELNKIQGDMALDKAKSDAVKIVGTLENLSEQVKADFVSKIKSSKKVSDVSSIVDDMNAFLSKLKDAKILINGCDKLGDAKDVLLQELASADTTAKIKIVTDKALLKQAREEGLALIPTFKSLTQDQRDDYTNRFNDDTKTLDQVNADVNELKQDAFEDYQTNVAAEVQNYKSSDKDTLLVNIQAATTFDEIDRLLKDSFDVNKALIDIDGNVELNDTQKTTLNGELDTAKTQLDLDAINNEIQKFVELKNIADKKNEGLALIPTFKSLSPEQITDYTNRFNDDTKTLDQVNTDINELKQDAFKDYQAATEAEAQNYKSADKDTLITDIQAATTSNEIDGLLKASFDTNKALIDIDGNAELDDTQKSILNGKKDVAKTQLDLDAINAEIGVDVVNNRVVKRNEGLALIPTFKSLTQDQRDDYTNRFNDDTKTLDQVNVDINELKQDAFEDYQTNVAAEVQNYKSSDKDTLLVNIQAATTFDEIDRLLKDSFDVNKALIDIDGNVELDDTQKTTLNGELDAAKTQLNLDAINDEIGTYVEQNRTRAKTEALTMVDDIYQELTSGNFSLSKFLNDLPDLLDNKNIDANLILSLTKKIEASGIISDNIKDKIAPLFPDTVESSTRLEKLFKNGALKDLYSEITKILTEGIQRQFDVGNVAGTISRYESIFNKFKEAFPVIKDLYAKKIVPAAIDIFTKGVDLSDESIDSLLELINTVLPEEISKEIHFDKLSSLIKTVAAKSLGSLSEIEVNSIIDLVAEFLPSKASLINKIKPYVYKLLFGGMTLEELNGLVESIKPGILATDIPEVGKVSKIVKAVFDGETWLHGGFWHPINSKINSLLNKIIGHTHILFEKGIFGMSSDDLSGMISGIKSAIDSVKGTLDGFLGAIIGAFTDISSIKTILGTISDKAAPIWTDSKSAATLIYGLFHNKLLNIDADSIDKIIEIVNAETGLTIDSNIGASLYELLHNMLLTPKVTILKDLDIIETMAETITRKPIPTQIKETVDKILPIVLNGQQESKS